MHLTPRRPRPLSGPVAIFATLVALVVSGIPPAHAADPDYPRLGLLGHVFGRGEPLVLPDGSLDPALLDAIARRHTVVLDATPLTEYRPDALVALRARRPEIRLLGYVQAQHIFFSAQADSTVNIPTRIRILVRNLNGHLYDRQGEEFHTANINLAKKNPQQRFVVAEALADFFVDQVLVPGGWDGLFFDRFCNSILWDQGPADSVDYVRAGYPTAAAFDAAWLAATDTLANRMRRRAGATPIFIGNCAQGTKYAAFNGWLRENFPNLWGGTWESNILAPNGGYLTDQAKYRTPYAGWMTAIPVPSLPIYDRENIRRARLSLASAALGEGYGTVSPADLDPRTGYMSWWFDEYAVDRGSGAASTSIAHTGWLGGALGPYGRMVWAQTGVEDACDLNPGFETAISTGWTFQQSIGATINPDPFTMKEGLYSARVNVPSATGGWAAVRLRSVGDVFWIADTYSATFWAKSSTPRTIEVAAVNSSGVPYVAAVESLTTTWTRHQVRLQGTFGYARLELRLGGAAGTVWLDDVHFQRGAAFVYRRDFEHGIMLLNAGGDPLDVVLESTFRRIAGSRDPLVNDGGSGTIARVPGGDAIFLLRATGNVEAPDPKGADAVARLAWTSITPNPSRADGAAVRLVLAVPRASAGPGVAAAITLHDVAGRQVRRLAAHALAPGAHALAWDGRDDDGRSVPPGVYFAHARVGATVAVRKLVRTD